MGLFTWRGAVADAKEAAARAAAGAAYLDRKLGPSWDRVIDVERLDIGSPIRCVLAQLGWAGHTVLLTPGWAVRYGFACGAVADFAYLIFRPRSLTRSFALLTVAWKALLAERRARADEAPASPRQAANREPGRWWGLGRRGDQAPGRERPGRRSGGDRQPREAVCT